MQKLFNDEEIKKIEAHYSAKYINDYDLERGSLDVTVTGAVFYVENPDRSLGHSNWFALFFGSLSSDLIITNAEHLVGQKYPAIKFGEDDYLVSRGRHDYVHRGEAFLDGGAAYVRFSPKYPPTHWARIDNDREVYELYEEK